MNGLLLGVGMLVSATGGAPALEPSRAAVVPAIFSFELPESASCKLPGGVLRESSGPRREWAVVRSVQPTSAKRSAR